MKNLLLIIMMMSYFIGFSQNEQNKLDDYGRISLKAYIPDQIEGLTAAVENNLVTKLNRIITKNGMASSALNNRFIISANIVVLTKDITPTAPPMHVYTLEISLFIGDGYEGKLFSQTAVKLKGVGKTETKAYMAALKNLSVNSPQYQEFIDEGKKRIIEYYNSQCDFILKDAAMLADQKKFDDALFKLMAIPEVCKECYDKAMDLSVTIYKRKMENECQVNIAKAEAAMAKDNWDEAATLIETYTPDMECYTKAKSMITQIKDHRCQVALGKAKGAWAGRNIKAAAGFLAEVPADSKCNGEAQALGKEIASIIDEKEKREWDLAYEKYDRGKSMQEKQQDADINLSNREIDYRENQEYELKKAQIKAARDVGVAYGENQPEVHYNVRDWR